MKEEERKVRRWRRRVGVTCELLLAAISDALLQVLQLVSHLLVLSLCLLALPPAGPIAVSISLFLSLLVYLSINLSVRLSHL